MLRENREVTVGCEEEADDCGIALVQPDDDGVLVRRGNVAQSRVGIAGADAVTWIQNRMDRKNDVVGGQRHAVVPTDVAS